MPKTQKETVEKLCKEVGRIKTDIANAALRLEPGDAFSGLLDPRDGDGPIPTQQDLWMAETAAQDALLAYGVANYHPDLVLTLKQAVERRNWMYARARNCALPMESTLEEQLGWY